MDPHAEVSDPQDPAQSQPEGWGPEAEAWDPEGPGAEAWGPEGEDPEGEDRADGERDEEQYADEALWDPMEPMHPYDPMDGGMEPMHPYDPMDDAHEADWTAPANPEGAPGVGRGRVQGSRGGAHSRSLWVRSGI